MLAMLLLLIAFIAGILTVLAPCVLPLLPVIVGGSLSGQAHDKKRPYIIAGALVGSIVVFTLLLKLSTSLVNLSPKVLTDLSGGLVIALGLASLFPAAWEELLGRTGWQAKAQRLLGKSERRGGELAGPLLIGAALGPVFSTCSPTYAFILASVLPRHLASGLVYLLAYCLGLGLALLLAVLLGRKLIARVGWLVDTHGLFRRIFGVIFIIIGVAIIAGWLVRAEIWVANRLPFDETRIEQRLLDTQVSNTKVKSNAANSSLFNVPGTVTAPALAGLTDWINSPPLQLSQLKGKVVLVDFWTYSCINCLRTLPYVQQWYQTYADKGFVVIGVHTPEFAFEHVPGNVEAAVKANQLTYPVALDNNHQTWDAFGNNSWPADYLIDKAGNVRDVHLGEGDYGKTEAAIQALLGEKAPLKTAGASVPFNQNQTPETYFGSDRQMNFVGSPILSNGLGTYSPASGLQAGQWTLGGRWQEAGDKITSAGPNSTLTFHAQSRDVYVVAGSETGQGQTVGVGLPNGSTAFGADVVNGQVDIAGSRLYHIVSLKQYGDITVTLTVPAGVSLYTFTFGS
jgi:cytochrome c biogenesis protein CcdA/thiol-disulfide isomerase/thioredoxin